MMITFSRMIAAAFVILLSAVAPVSASGDVEAREKWAESISSAGKNECKGEDEGVRKLLDYAAILVVHNETDEAKDVLARAATAAKGKLCSGALLENLAAHK